MSGFSASEAEVNMLAAELDNFARLRRILEEQVASLRAERTTLTGSGCPSGFDSSNCKAT